MRRAVSFSRLLCSVQCRASCTFIAVSTFRKSSADSAPIFFFNRSLLAVLIWSATAFTTFPSTETRASLGKTFLVLLVNGTTWTLLRNLLAASLLTMTAGRTLWISPPMDGLKLTHHISPRFIFYVLDQSLRPLQSLLFAFFILRHLR